MLRLAVLRFAVERFAVLRLAVERLASRLAVLRLAVLRFAVERFAVDRLAVERLAVLRFAVERLAVERLAVERFAVDRFAVERLAERFAVPERDVAAGIAGTAGSGESGSSLELVSAEESYELRLAWRHLRRLGAPTFLRHVHPPVWLHRHVRTQCVFTPARMFLQAMCSLCACPKRATSVNKLSDGAIANDTTNALLDRFVLHVVFGRVFVRKRVHDVESSR